MADEEKNIPSDDELQKVFYKLSSDGGDTISVKDVKKFIQLLGQNPSNKQVTDAIKECDLTEANNLSFEDCKIVLWTVWNECDLEKELREAFAEYDKDHNGYWDANEFKEFMLRYGESLTLGELDEMMKLFDINHDNKIDYEEFVKAMTECDEENGSNEA